MTKAGEQILATAIMNALHLSDDQRVAEGYPPNVVDRIDSVAHAVNRIADAIEALTRAVERLDP